MCPWPIGRGARLPTWLGEFDSRRALFFKFGGRRSEVGSGSLECGNISRSAFHIGNIALGSLWEENLAVDQVVAGSNPVRGAWLSDLRPPTSDLRIKYCAVRQRLERPVSETGVCEFESHPYNLALSRFGASHVLVRGKQPGLAVHEGKTELE